MSHYLETPLVNWNLLLSNGIILFQSPWALMWRLNNYGLMNSPDHGTQCRCLFPIGPAKCNRRIVDRCINNAIKRNSFTEIDRTMIFFYRKNAQGQGFYNTIIYKYYRILDRDSVNQTTGLDLWTKHSLSSTTANRLSPLIPSFILFTRTPTTMVTTFNISRVVFG